MGEQKKKKKKKEGTTHAGGGLLSAQDLVAQLIQFQVDGAVKRPELEALLGQLEHLGLGHLHLLPRILHCKYFFQKIHHQ